MNSIDRRTVLIGSLCVPFAGCATGARADEHALLAPSVTIGLRIYIPSQVVHFLFLSFNGGDKALLSAQVDLGMNGPSSFRRTGREFGATRKYNNSDTRTVAGKPDWFRTLTGGAQAIETGQEQATDATINTTWRVPPGATHGCYLFVEGANPLAPPGSPAIDCRLALGLRQAGGGIEYMLAGEHDGFPNYAVQLNGRTVYNYDCVAAGEGPSALGGTIDVDVSQSWQRL